MKNIKQIYIQKYFFTSILQEILLIGIIQYESQKYTALPNIVRCNMT